MQINFGGSFLHVKRSIPNFLTCLAVYLPHKRFARKETKVFIYRNTCISLDENVLEKYILLCIYIYIYIYLEL